MKCQKCGSELLLDHVVEKGDLKEYYYACVNPRCGERGKAWRPTGETRESTIRTKD